MAFLHGFMDSLAVNCPVCGAAPSNKCKINAEFPRFESHIERGWIAAKGHLRNAIAETTETVDAGLPKEKH